MTKNPKTISPLSYRESEASQMHGSHWLRHWATLPEVYSHHLRGPCGPHGVNITWPTLDSALVMVFTLSCQVLVWPMGTRACWGSLSRSMRNTSPSLVKPFKFSDCITNRASPLKTLRLTPLLLARFYPPNTSECSVHKDHVPRLDSKVDLIDTVQ